MGSARRVTRLGTWQGRGVDGVSGVVATGAVQRASQWCRCWRIMQRLGPPPFLGTTAAMLAATRGKGVDRMPPEEADFPCKRD